MEEHVMFTVGKMAKMFGLSRTALLYYDDIGLLCPSERAENGYRLYSDSDVEKLRQIVSLRDAGIALDEISGFIKLPESDISSILLKRLNELNTDIESIKNQQKIIINLLQSNDIKTKRILSPEAWIKILKDAGVDEDTALKWHTNFETQSPERHHDLLRVLGFGPEELKIFKTIYDSRNDMLTDDIQL
jgi:DNA-binding transcriptional MerR regulator